MYLILFGVFLAVLPISFNYMDNLNHTYAGYVALTVCGLAILLILEMLVEGDEQLTMKSALFLAGIIGIAVLIFLTVIKAYNNEYQTMLYFLYSLIALSMGAFIAIKILTFLEKYQRKFILNLIALVISILLLRSFESFTTILNYFFNWNNPLIILFLTSFGFIIIFWGLVEGGKGLLVSLEEKIGFKKRWNKLRKLARLK